MAITSNPAVINGAAITGQGISTFLNVTTTTLVKAVKGRIVKINVNVAGSANGAIYDHASTSGIAAANLVAQIPEVVGTYTFDFPCQVGIVVVPPTGGTVSVSFN
jgi:hypothetical protein